MPFTYIGDDPRVYPQYRDADTGRPLSVSPGGTYDIEAVVTVMAVPPPDGRWAEAAADPPPVVPPSVPPSPAPPPAVNPSPAQDEGN